MSLLTAWAILCGEEKVMLGQCCTFRSATRQPRQTGGLQTDGAMVRSFSDHAGTRRALEWTFAAFSVQSWGATFLTSAIFREADVMLLLKKETELLM